MQDEIPAVRLPSIHVRRLRVLAGAALFVAAGIGLYSASPWLLPLAVAEGPLLQQPTGASVRVVWYLSRSDQSDLRLNDAPAAARVTMSHAGRRHSALIEGLSPGVEYRYEITDGAERVLAGHTFRTAGSADRPFSFVVFGDSGKGTKEQFVLARQMQRVQADFLVHTGDIVYPDGSRRRYRRRFFDPYRELLPGAATWPCLGNHDVSDAAALAYHEIFELPENGPADQPPEQNYWFDFGNARFVCFNSNLPESELSASIAPWLAQVLADPQPVWRFVVFHHPPYTAGSHDPALSIQRAIVPVLEAGGVDVVFNGHDHMYQRTVPIISGAMVSETGLPAPQAAGQRGVVYIVSGAGGARLYDLMPESQRPAYFAALNNQVHSFTHVQIEGRSLSLKQIDVNGKALDVWSVTKPARLQKQ